MHSRFPFYFCLTEKFVDKNPPSLFFQRGRNYYREFLTDTDEAALLRGFLLAFLVEVHQFVRLLD